MGVNIDRVYEQNETSKNNDVARKSEISSVTGYSPDEWVVSNNPYMNDDGTVKDEYKNIDFSAVMANAKAAGNTEAYNAASVARYYKIMGDYQKYGQYDYGNYIVPGKQKTETAREFDEQIAANDRVLVAEQNNANADRELQCDLADKSAQNALDQIHASARYGTDSGSTSSVTSMQYNNDTSHKSVASTPTLTASQAVTAIKNGEISKSVIDAYNYYYGTSYTIENPPKLNTDDYSSSWSDYSENTSNEYDYETALNSVYDDSSKTVKKYIRNVLKPLITENTVTETELKENLLANSKEYDLEVDDLKAICSALEVDTMWIDDYKNKGLFGWGSGVKAR